MGGAHMKVGDQMDTSKFKNASGTWLLKQLFYEMADTERDRVLYTLKPEDHMGFPSIRRLYLEANDGTDVTFYNTYFGGYPHWKRLLTCSWFVDCLAEIKEEHRASLQSLLVRQMTVKAQQGDTIAIKYLLEEGWLKGKVGRPSDFKIKQEAAEMNRADRELLEDFERIKSL